MASKVMKKLIPLFDRVLVQRAEKITRTESGVVIPERGQAKVLKGKVIAIGPGSLNNNGELIPLGLKVGDSVLLPDYGGTKVDLEDEKSYSLFREKDILAKIEDYDN